MGTETTKHPDCAHQIAHHIKKVLEKQGLNFEGADRTGLEPVPSTRDRDRAKFYFFPSMSCS